MKRVKRVLALLAAFALVLAMAVPAWADKANLYTISAPAGSNHTYQVYQIFTGDYSNGKLSNVKWGQNSKNHEGTNASAAVDSTVLATIAGLGGKTDAEIWKGIEQYVDFGTAPVAEVTSTTPASVPAGYYVIKDKDGSQDGKQDAYTNYIVQVAGNVKITPKSSIPTVKKEVKDINDSTETDLGEWQKDADHDFNDQVLFRLTGTLPENYATYTSYEYIFHDTMSKGLTFDPASVEIYHGDEKTGTKIDANNYTVSNQSGTDGKTEITIQFANLKTAVSATFGDKITVVYKATLNENSVIGSEGNPNKVYLEFSNNPNGNGTGKTPEDTVTVFTYKVAANKVDGDGKKLAGAGFKLSKFDMKNNRWELVGYQNVKLDASGNPVETDGRYEVESATATSFAWNRIDDGKYKLEEVVTPAGYNTIDPVEFDVVAGHANLTLSSLSGTKTTGTVGEYTFKPNNAEGSLTTDIVNQSGTVLPSTGGMGTTVFYVVGGGLMAVAVVLLVTKKRMENKR
mgnify:CR=1 FL=1